MKIGLRIHLTILLSFQVSTKFEHKLSIAQGVSIADRGSNLIHFVPFKIIYAIKLSKFL